MAWRLVRQPDGKYACFSDAVNNFTQGPMTEEEVYEVFESRDCSRAEIAARLDNANANPKAFAEVCQIARATNGEEDLREMLEELGITTEYVSVILA